MFEGFQKDDDFFAVDLRYFKLFLNIKENKSLKSLKVKNFFSAAFISKNFFTVLVKKIIARRC